MTYAEKFEDLSFQQKVVMVKELGELMTTQLNANGKVCVFDVSGMFIGVWYENGLSDRITRIKEIKDYTELKSMFPRVKIIDGESHDD
ncbi:hypothetical protein AAG747_24280 [Rapidithrix thailandica]|uniref:Uncharacterized protein n=1 Tax=Rapidithrix thailandica TaxID=413964 RepID=A0AAW9SK11_9BACT